MSLNEDIGKLTNTWPILLDHFSHHWRIAVAKSTLFIGSLTDDID
jgi:hypothetical protein